MRSLSSEMLWEKRSIDRLGWKPGISLVLSLASLLQPEVEKFTYSVSDSSKELSKRHQSTSQGTGHYAKYCLPTIFCFVLATLHSMWDLSSPTRDQIVPPALEAQSPNHWTAMEVPCQLFLIFFKIKLNQHWWYSGEQSWLPNQTESWLMNIDWMFTMHPVLKILNWCWWDSNIFYI